MTGCDSFRARFHEGTADAALLAHLRACDRCLDFAAHLDPDVMFRALGGEEMVPPGGIDAFVGDVMQQVRVRFAETTVAASRERVVSWPRRLAVAATLAIAVSGAMLMHYGRTSAVAPAPAVAAVQRTIFATKPAVETYDSQNATIVEVPAEESGDDVKIVMVFDENLPADL